LLVSSGVVFSTCEELFGGPFGFPIAPTDGRQGFDSLEEGIRAAGSVVPPGVDERNVSVALRIFVQARVLGVLLQMRTLLANRADRPLKKQPQVREDMQAAEVAMVETEAIDRRAREAVGLVVLAECGFAIRTAALELLADSYTSNRSQVRACGATSIWPRML
jgi:hypothetical protein